MKETYYTKVLIQEPGRKLEVALEVESDEPLYMAFWQHSRCHGAHGDPSPEDVPFAVIHPGRLSGRVTVGRSRCALGTLLHMVEFPKGWKAETIDATMRQVGNVPEDFAGLKAARRKDRKLGLVTQWFEWMHWRRGR